MGFDLGALSTGLQIVSGLTGMQDAASANRTSRRQIANSNAILERLKALNNKSTSLAEGYDPVAEAKAAQEYATQTAGKGFGMALDKWNADNIRGGGSVGSDSLNLTYANNIASKWYDPVRASVYETAANATNAKMAVLGSALQQGQSLAGAFVGNAQASQVDPTGSMGLLGSAVNTIMAGQKKADPKANQHDPNAGFTIGKALNPVGFTIPTATSNFAQQAATKALGGDLPQLGFAQEAPPVRRSTLGKKPTKALGVAA